MIGIFDYTVILTYLSLISATAGIVFTLNDAGHPYIGVMFLMFSALCDAFDGKVARTKKNRSETEKRFGIQIDSLSDMVAFGVLPACIGVALYRVSSKYNAIHISNTTALTAIEGMGMLAIIFIYVLAALIRLAYFNVTEEERQSSQAGGRSHYIGLPVTSAGLIFPTLLLVQYTVQYFVKSFDITPIYFGVMLLTGIAFVSKFKMKKLGLKSILLLVAIGILESAVITMFWYLRITNG